MSCASDDWLQNILSLSADEITALDPEDVNRRLIKTDRPTSYRIIATDEGSGKTTALTDYAEELADQGLNVAIVTDTVDHATDDIIEMLSDPVLWQGLLKWCRNNNVSQSNIKEIDRRISHGQSRKKAARTVIGKNNGYEQQFDLTDEGNVVVCAYEMIPTSQFQSQIDIVLADEAIWNQTNRDYTYRFQYTSDLFTFCDDYDLDAPERQLLHALETVFQLIDRKWKDASITHDIDSPEDVQEHLMGEEDLDTTKDITSAVDVERDDGREVHQITQQLDLFNMASFDDVHIKERLHAIITGKYHDGSISVDLQQKWDIDGDLLFALLERIRGQALATNDDSTLSDLSTIEENIRFIQETYGSVEMTERIEEHEGDLRQTQGYRQSSSGDKVYYQFRSSRPRMWDLFETALNSEVVLAHARGTPEQYGQQFRQYLRWKQEKILYETVKGGTAEAYRTIHTDRPDPVTHQANVGDTAQNFATCIAVVEQQMERIKGKIAANITPDILDPDLGRPAPEDYAAEIVHITLPHGKNPTRERLGVKYPFGDWKKVFRALLPLIDEDTAYTTFKPLVKKDDEQSGLNGPLIDLFNEYLDDDVFDAVTDRIYWFHGSGVMGGNQQADADHLIVVGAPTMHPDAYIQKYLELYDDAPDLDVSTYKGKTQTIPGYTPKKEDNMRVGCKEPRWDTVHKRLEREQLVSIIERLRDLDVEAKKVTLITPLYPEVASYVDRQEQLWDYVARELDEAQTVLEDGDEVDTVCNELFGSDRDESDWEERIVKRLAKRQNLTVVGNTITLRPNEQQKQKLRAKVEAETVAVLIQNGGEMTKTELLEHDDLNHSPNLIEEVIKNSDVIEEETENRVPPTTTVSFEPKM